MFHLVDFSSLYTYIIAISVLIFVLRLYFFLRGKFRPLRLAGKHVLITGGTSGLGAELAKECYYRGAFVTLIARDKDTLFEILNNNEVHRETTGLGHHMQVFQLDICQADKLDSILDQAERRFGKIFLCFNCASVN